MWEVQLGPRGGAQLQVHLAGGHLGDTVDSWTALTFTRAGASFSRNSLWCATAAHTLWSCFAGTLVGLWYSSGGPQYVDNRVR